MSKGAGHTLQVRVYYEDTDSGGVVYYANYFRYAERARTEMLRQSGYESSQMMEDLGIFIAVRHVESDFLKPARLDDLLWVHSHVGQVKGASFSVSQVIKREGEELVRMSLRLACADLKGGPARLPQDIRQALENFIVSDKRG